MYKGTSQAMQRAHGVRLIAPQKAYISDDCLPGTETLTLAELVEEQSRLRGEIARCENELRAQKAEGRIRAAKGIGYRKAALCQRIGEINDRIKLARQVNVNGAWRQAIMEICPDQAAAIEARYRELEGAANG